MRLYFKCMFLIFVISIFRITTVNAENDIFQTPEYKEILREYSKVLFKEFCYSSQDICREKFSERVAEIDFENASIGSVKKDDGNLFYVASPIKKKDQTVYTLFLMKEFSNLEVCYLTIVNSKVEIIVKDVLSGELGCE